MRKFIFTCLTAVTFTAIQAQAESIEFKLTVPVGSTAFVGSKVKHYMPFTEIAADSTEENVGETTYIYTLDKNKTYNYRVSKQGKLTNAGKFKMTDGYSVTVSDTDLEGDPKEIIRDVNANNKYNLADIYLNADRTGCLNLNSGEDFRIVNLRSWEIVDTTVGNYFLEPDYHYTVIGEDGQPSTDVIEVSEDGKIHAKGEGTAIVLVTYDALNAPGQLGGPLFSAIWPENTGVIVVKVGADNPDIDTNMLINADFNPTTDHKMSGKYIDAELDVIYFCGEYAEYTFTPSNATDITVATPLLSGDSMSYGGFTTENVVSNPDASYTVKLVEGKNIVKITNSAGSEYQVILGHAQMSVAMPNLKILTHRYR